MPKDRPPSYTPAPELPADPEVRRRFGLIISVIAETTTVTAAATEAGLSRNHFQTILHRVIAAMIAELTPKAAGRPAKPARELELEAENRRLRSELEALQERTAAIDRMLTVVGGFASGKTPLPRPRGKKKKPEDPEPAPTQIRREVARAMRDHDVPVDLCIAALGISASTVQRSRHEKPQAKHGAKHHCAAAKGRVRTLVRETHGLVGASNLGRMCGLPRRICAEIKRAELRELEHERKERCAAVRIAAPGIMRGFDAMHLQAMDGPAYWLVAADAAIPYRTSIVTVPTYDAEHVIGALMIDFEEHGPPLVIRLDRISCQRTREVESFLDDRGVLALHGPPRYPRYYGQLERQNREHRAWSAWHPLATRRELAAAGGRMKTILNTKWPRPTLEGCTAEQVWRGRRTVDIDRRQLRSDVDTCTRGLVTTGVELLRARRIAIESALVERKLLTINQGGWR